MLHVIFFLFLSLTVSWLHQIVAQSREVLVFIPHALELWTTEKKRFSGTKRRDWANRAAKCKFGVVKRGQNLCLLRQHNQLYLNFNIKLVRGVAILLSFLFCNFLINKFQKINNNGKAKHSASEMPQVRYGALFRIEQNPIATGTWCVVKWGYLGWK